MKMNNFTALIVFGGLGLAIGWVGSAALDWLRDRPDLNRASVECGPFVVDGLSIDNISSVGYPAWAVQFSDDRFCLGINFDSLDVGSHEPASPSTFPSASLSTHMPEGSVNHFGEAPIRVRIERSDDLVVGTFEGVTRQTHTGATAQRVEDGQPTMPISGRFQFERERAVRGE